MKSSMRIATFILVIFLLQNTISPMRINWPLSRHNSNYDHHKKHVAWPSTRERRVAESDYDGERRQMEVVIGPRAGSRLPDCSHACGSCSPCRLVIVSLACASLAEAETCPISYRCMCNNKSYPVP